MWAKFRQSKKKSKLKLYFNLGELDKILRLFGFGNKGMLMKSYDNQLATERTRSFKQIIQFDIEVCPNQPFVRVFEVH